MFSITKLQNKCVIISTRKFLCTSTFLQKDENPYLKYIQGQSPKPGIREYFYFIDHQGMLFLDDARIKNFTSCFKEIQFLDFFFKRLRVNETDRYPGFPYVSLCGRERNYVRCDDLPIVFTKLNEESDVPVLMYNNCGNKLYVPFEPTKIFMGASGRIYHPGPDILHGIGLIKSQLAIDFSRNFSFEGERPTHFTFQGTVHRLDNSLRSILIKIGRQEE